MKNHKTSFWIFLAVFYAVWIFRATWFYGRVDLSIANETMRSLFSLGVKFLLWAAPAMAYLLWVERVNPFTGLRLNTRPNPKGLWIGIAASILFLGTIALFTLLTTGKNFGPLERAAPLVVLGSLAGNAVNALWEEMMFRGFILPQLQQRLSFWAANVVQAVLFVAIHWPNWLWTGGFHWSLVFASASILLLALFLGWLLRRTGSLWPGVVVHVANNFLAAFLG